MATLHDTGNIEGTSYTADSLPPMKNFAVMNGKELGNIFAQFSKAKGAILNDKDEMLRTVHTPKGLLVLSAARLDRNEWHVRCRDGLLKSVSAGTISAGSPERQGVSQLNAKASDGTLAEGVL